MRYDPNIHHRRSIRLACHDYSEFGACFVTICAYRRRCVFGNGMVRAVIERAWEELPGRFAGVQLDEFVVMPNHVHFILWLPGSDGVGAGLAPPEDGGTASRAPTLGDVVCAFKSISAVAINKHLGQSGVPVWQRNYFERVLRNEKELNAIRQYIACNPSMWDDDCENPERRVADARAVPSIREEIEAVLDEVRQKKPEDHAKTQE